MTHLSYINTHSQDTEPEAPQCSSGRGCYPECSELQIKEIEIELCLHIHPFISICLVCLPLLYDMDIYHEKLSTCLLNLEKECKHNLLVHK